jgi:heptaprenyl diphosphate synthase
VGKPRGLDLKEGNLTLPTIYAANNGCRTQLFSLITRPRKSKRDIEAGLDLITASGAIEQTQGVARWYADEAKACLGILPQGPYKIEMMKLADFVVERRA